LAPGKYVSRDTTFRGMTVYTAPDGTQNLYAAGLTDGEYIPGLPGPRIIRSTDGSNFAPVNLVLPAAVQTRKGLQPILGFRSLVVFNGRLFMTATPTSVGDGVVMEATPGDASGGTLILKQVGPADLDVFEMEVFNGYLYVGAGDEQYGYSVWKTQATGVGPYLFTPVVTNGAGRGAQQTSVVSMATFKNQLYVGTAGVNPTVGGGSEIIRINPDNSWQLLVGNARQTPQGFMTPLSGMSDGFNNPFNVHVWRMTEFNGQLYAGTNDDSWTFRGSSLDATLRPQFGFDLFATPDGVTWNMITQDGFGHPYDFGLRVMSATPSGLFLGSVDYVSGTSIYLCTGSCAPSVPAATQLSASGQPTGVSLSWLGSSAASQYLVLRAIYTPNSSVGVSPSILNIPSLPTTDWIHLPHIAGNDYFSPTTLIPGGYTNAGSSTTTSFLDTGVAGLTQYSYYVLAQNAGGNTSLPSNTAMVTTPLLTGTTTPTVTSTASVSVTPSTTATTGTPTATATQGSGATATATATTTATATAQSSPTATVTATATSGTSSQPPAAPSSLTASSGQTGKVVLNWTGSSTPGVTYRIYRGSSSGSETAFRSGVTGTSFTDTTAPRLTPTWYKVTAVSSAGVESPASNEAWGVAF
ncbi:MAG TPA: hypothetical protein VK009_26665, partial [Chloroflexota bacterium]|nr:hypothetical protein [Chloroflexota bacterium]